MGFGAFPELAESAEEQAAEFDRAQTSGIKIARTWFDFGWALPTYPTGTPDYSGAEMGYFCTWLAAMQSLGIQVVLTMGWHFPGNVCDLTRGTVPTCTPTGADETVWAGMVSSSLHNLMNERGFTNIIAAMFFTEPNNNDGTNIPSGYTALEYYAHLVTIARAQIASDDGSRTPILPRVMLMAAEEFVTGGSYPYLEYMRSNADAQVDGYTAHRYFSIPEFAPLGLVATNALAYTAWIDAFKAAVDTAAPKEFWADETGFLVGGEDDSTGYRKTADAGWQLVRQIDGHMQAGVTASFPWMLQDQRWFFDRTSFLEYGVAGDPSASNAVHPSWYAFSLHANLTGGGGGTAVYRSIGGSATLHGTAVSIPFGVRNAVHADGEWTFVVINEGIAADVRLKFSASLGGRTVYRYDYSGEMPPAAATDPAYIKPWTMKFEGVTTSIPATRINGRGFSIFSTMNISAPEAENLALTATASSADTDASGSPTRVNDGNWTNVVGSQNGWKKSTDAATPLVLEWDAAVTVGRIDLAFVGTTVGVVYATYADTSEPAPVADYTLEHWNGSTWVELVDVTGNSDVNPSHSLTPVVTTKIRLTVSSAAATAQVNQLGIYAA